MSASRTEMARARNMRGSLSALSHELGLHPSLREAMTRVLQLSMESVKAESGSIMLLDEDGEVSHAVLAYAGDIRDMPTDSMRPFVRQGLAGWVISNRQPALVSSTWDDPRWLKQSWEMHDIGVRSAVCIPLISSSRVLGVLTLVQRQRGGFSPGDLALLCSLAFCVSSTSIRQALQVDRPVWQ